MIHKFEAGQFVVPAHPLRPSRNTYLILRQLPSTSYEPQYVIQGVSSGIECIVCESEIKAAGRDHSQLPVASLGAFKARDQAARSS
jgi:hypothetical protein